MALRALKTDEEIAGIPLDQPILIEIPSAASNEEPEPHTEGKKPDKIERAESSDDGAKTLQEQLEAAQKAANEANARADREAQAAAEARRQAAERLREADEAKARNTALEGDVISGGLSAAQADRDAAKAAFKTAFEAGDADAMAEAQSKIGRAEAKILGFEGGAAELAEARKTERQPEARQEQALQQQPGTWEERVRSNANLLRSEQDWMIKNKTAFEDSDFGKRVDFAYSSAVQQPGMVRGSPAYFNYIERAAGLIPDDGNNGNDNQGSRDVQAPPSRNERDAGGKPVTNRITLTPDQREIAKSMGVSEIEYAKQVQNFDAARKADPDKYR